MNRRTFTLIPFFLLFLSNFAAAQAFKFVCGINAGMSRLQHNVRFETTEMHDLYKTIEISHRPDNYAWEDFVADYGLRNSIMMPRAALTLKATYKSFPFFVLGEAGTSSSSYQKPMFALTAGLEKEFGNNIDDYFFNVRAGFKYVLRDAGFGSETLVNSVGNKEARSYIQTYFNPERPLGTQKGNLLVAAFGMGYYLDLARMSSVGLEGYGELDTTNETARQARMNVVGVQAYVRFSLFKPDQPDIKRF